MSIALVYHYLQKSIFNDPAWSLIFVSGKILSRISQSIPLVRFVLPRWIILDVEIMVVGNEQMLSSIQTAIDCLTRCRKIIHSWWDIHYAPSWDSSGILIGTRMNSLLTAAWIKDKRRSSISSSFFVSDLVNSIMLRVVVPSRFSRQCSLCLGFLWRW